MFERFFQRNDDFIIFLTIIVATIAIAILVNRYFVRMIRRSSGLMNSNPSNYSFIRHVVVITICMVGFSWAVSEMPPLKSLANSLLAGAGILAVALGLASQQAMSNIISGFFIVVFKPFKVNDRLKIKEIYNGIVEDITLRHTVIRDAENRRVVIPNAVISNEIIVNADFIEDKIIKFIEFPLNHDANIDRAKAIMKEEVEKHPFFVDPRNKEEQEKNEEKIQVRIININEISVTIRAWACAKNNADAFVMGCDLLESIRKRFLEENIAIAYSPLSIIKK